MKTFAWLALVILLVGAAPTLGGEPTPPVDDCTNFGCER
jgi:hypothetical protein